MIKSITEGGMVIVEIKIDFDSDQYKKKFEASIDLKFGDLASISAHIEREFTRLNVKEIISIKAKQIGGRPLELFNIIPENNSEVCAN